MQKPERVTRADCDIPCVDTWRLALARETAMRAYLDLERRGQIAIQYPVRISERSGCVEIRYLAALPHDWTLEALAEAEERIVAAWRQQRMAV